MATGNLSLLPEIVGNLKAISKVWKQNTHKASTEEDVVSFFLKDSRFRVGCSLDGSIFKVEYVAFLNPFDFVLVSLEKWLGNPIKLGFLQFQEGNLLINQVKDMLEDQIAELNDGDLSTLPDIADNMIGLAEMRLKYYNENFWHRPVKE